MIKVVLVGAAGRMGLEVLRAISEADDLELVGAVDRVSFGESTAALAGRGVTDLEISNKLGLTLDTVKPDVLVDFTHGSAAPENAMIALKRKIPVVIGASGLSTADQSAVRESCREFETPACLVPNFAVGAVLMTRFAELASAWMPDVEIIEIHHKDKIDSPSGTAMNTAERIQAARRETPRRVVGAVEKVAGARGAGYKEVQIHSVRLPGFIASQEIIFGGAGERLILRHDSIDRASFMEGVKLAIRKVPILQGFVIGLDKMMF